MTDELQAISVGLGVNLSKLDADLATSSKKIKAITGPHKVTFIVGAPDLGAVRAQIRTILEQKYVITPSVGVSVATATAFRRSLTSKLDSLQPISIRIKPKLDATEVARIRREIMAGLGAVPVKITAARGGGGGAGPASSAGSALTPHERAVNQDAANRTARAVKATQTAPAVKAAPAPPVVASAPAAAAQAAPARPVAPPVVSAAPAAQQAARKTGQAAARPAPAAKAAPAAPKGRVTEVYFNSETGKHHRRDAVTGEELGPVRTTDRARILQKIADRGPGRVTIDRKGPRVDQPTTPEEIEYASRPARVSLPRDAQAEFEQEKRGRGVRGASRSGARQRGERELTADDLLNMDMLQQSEDVARAAERDREIRDPSRRRAKTTSFGTSYSSPAPAFYGNVHPRLRGHVDKLQFYKFDPRLGSAFEALSGGDEKAARELLRGFSLDLAGADPKKRKRFFRLFRNSENVPPEMLEKHAALQGLFSEINLTGARKQLASAEAEVKAFQKPEGPKSDWPEAASAEWDRLLMQRKIAQQALTQTLGGVRPSKQAAAPKVAEPKRPERGAPNYNAVEAAGGLNKPKSGFTPEVAVTAAPDVIPPLVPKILPPRTRFSLKRAGGGPVPAGSLLARIQAAEAAKKAAAEGTLVGENRPETYVSKSGVVEVVGEHGPSVATFPEDGQIVPFVPPWLRNLRAKDMTRRAGGGPVRGFGGTRFRSFAPGEGEAIKSGLLTAAGSANVQRVFVVNWPAGGIGAIASNPRGTGIAAGPIRFAGDKDAAKFAQELGGSIGKQLKGLLGETTPVTPKEPEPETAKLPGSNAFERQQARQQARGATANLEQTILSARSATSEAQQLIPVRSLSVAVGQIFSTIFGGRGDALTRAKAANDLAARATTATSNYRAERQKLLLTTNQLRKAEDPRAQTALIEQIKSQAAATRLARNEAEGLASKAKEASEGIIDQGGALKNLAAGTAGVVVGTLGFSAALGAAQGIIELTGKTVGPVVERLTGFRNQTAETSKALAEQTRQAGGAVQSTVALTAAQAGLSAEAARTISPLLEQRAAIEAGNTALQDSLKLVHSAIQIRRQSAGGGTPGGIGSNTGGFFDTGAVLLGGIPSTQEQLTKELGGALPSSAEFAANAKNAEFLANQPPTSLSNSIIKSLTARAGAGGAVAPGAILDPAVAAAEVSSEFSKKLADSKTYIETFQGALDKAGKQFVIDQQKVGESADAVVKRQTDAAAAAQAFSSAGLLDTAKLIRDTNLVIRDAQGNAIKTADQARQFYLDINKGFQTPDVGLLIKAMTERIIPAQKAQFRAEGVLQRQLLPGSVAFSQLAAPTAGLTGGPAFEAGLVGVDNRGKIDRAAQTAADKYKSLVGGAVTEVNALIQQGRQDLVDLVPPTLRGEFTDVLGEVEKTGAAISQIQTDLQQQQANVAISEYNNQLRIARRSLSDARDIQAALAGEAKNTLGGIEGQNIALQRQLQLLQFELQQRQINFRLATAGFVAPGTTPEERAARIKMAEKEAEFAQKQLDIQKQLASNQQRQIQITVGRDVTDLLAQIQLLEQGRQVTINTAAASKALDILNKKQQMLVEKAGTYIEEGTKIVTAVMQATSQVQTQTGKGFAYILSQTAQAWGIFGTQAQRILDALRGTAPSGTSPAQQGALNKMQQQQVYGATGLMFDTSGPTNLTVGEAGKETVAVLRNPRQMTLPQLMAGTREFMPTGMGARASSGGLHITVVVTGNTISKDTDLHQLAEEIADAAARKAEERMLQKANLLSGRRA